MTGCTKKKKKKNAGSVNTHYRHGLGKDVVLCSAPINGCRDTQHRTWKTKLRVVFSGGGGWEAEACTPPGVLLIYLWGLYLMSRLTCMNIVADLIACRL